MAYYRKPALGMDDIHHLLGVTLRDARQERCGRIVGLDYNHEQPIMDVLWDGQKKVERVTISLDQLAGLMKAFIDARRLSNVRSVDSSGRVSSKASTTTSTSDDAIEKDTQLQQRRA